MELSTAQVIAAFGAVISAVVYLWKQQTVHHTETKEQLKDCHQGHAEANEKLFDLNGRMSHLEGEHDGVEKMAAAVIKEVRSLKED